MLFMLQLWVSYVSPTKVGQKTLIRRKKYKWYHQL